MTRFLNCFGGDEKKKSLSDDKPYEPVKTIEVDDHGTKGKLEVDENDADIRGNWGTPIDFILSALGYAIGLGNVWRFPYLCYDNGGGIFLFAYCVMLLLAALPIMVLEMVFGQFTSVGCISAWKISPLFKGVGYGMALVSFYFCLYYNIIIAYTIYYMVASFKNPLPWSNCNNTWNTDDCYVAKSIGDDVIADNSTFDFNETWTDAAPTKLSKVYASEEYFYNQVLGITDGIHDMGSIRWEVAGCFMLVWIIVYFCIIKGVKTSGKVVYFTATFPFLVLFVLLFRGITLEGAGTGIAYFIKPDFSQIFNARVWTSAANQVFISYGAGWGGIHTLASYNKYRNNCIRDCIIIVILGALTSILAGMVIFSVLGFMAHDSGLDIQDVVSSGPGLAFIAYPEALARLPLPQVWSFLFFFMLLTLGLDSEFVTLETVITAIIDEMSGRFPSVRRKKFWIILATCLTMSIVSLPLCLQGGMYIEQLLDWFSAGFSPMLLGLAEVLVISYVYGIQNYRKDIKAMLGYYPGVYWIVCWLLVTPGLIILVFIFNFIDYSPAYYGDYVFPPWAQALGWLLTLTSLLCILFYAMYNVIFLQEGSFVERIKAASKPSPTWGPAREEDRKEGGYPALNSLTKKRVTDEETFEQLQDCSNV